MQTVDNEEKRICDRQRNMWESLIPGYLWLSPSQKKKAKKEYKKNMATYITSLAISMPIEEVRKETNMYTPCKTTDENTEKRDYLKGRQNCIFKTKVDAAEKRFFLVDDAEPRTVDELKARLEAGLYVYDEKAAEKYKERYGCDPGWSSFTRWRDPAKPADREGFNAFMDKLKKESNIVWDAIEVQDPKDALPIVQGFETWTD